MKPDKIDKNKIFVDENIPLLADAMNTCGEIIRFSGRKLTNQELIKGGCWALFVRSTTNINSALLDGSEVKFVGTATSGIDHVDTDYLKRKKICFAYAPGSNANSVAEYVIYSILKWRNVSNADLQNKTIGIVGYGNIGRIVANYSNYLGLKVLINDPPLKDLDFPFPNFVKYSELDELCSKSDIITSHVPLTSEGKYPTYHLFNKDNISLIKNGSLFIHTSRGGVAEEESLLMRLASNEIHAAIDVWENEPLINTELANTALLSTPHIAGYSRDGKLRGAMLMAKAYEKFSGEKPDYSTIETEISEYKPNPNTQYKNYDRLFNLLEKSRKLDDDDSALRATLELDIDNRAKTFDSQRKNYPVRREIL